MRFDLKSLLNDKINKYELLINKNNINFTAVVRGRDFFIDADKDGIGIVLDNLFTNAIKYTNDKNIVVEIDELKNKIVFKIRNGISSQIENLDKLWKPFYVLEISRSKELSGTGLGLSIVDEILKKHGFEYNVKLINNSIEFYIVFNN